MKKLAAFALLLLILLPLCPIYAAYSAEPSENQQKSAQILYDLGLFRGTDKGFELERTLTRAEGAVLLTRFLGKEAEALRQNLSSPFTDLPEWVKPYVGWLYKNGYAKGVSATKYAPQELMKFGHFALFLGRCVGLDDEAIVYGFDAISADVYAENKDRFISRGESAELALNTLASWHHTAQTTLANALVRSGVLTSEALDAVVTPVMPSFYGTLGWGVNGYALTREIFGVIVAQSTVGVFNWGTGGKAFPDEITAIFGRDGDYNLYAFDPMTLEHTKIGNLGSYERPFFVMGQTKNAACLLIFDGKGSSDIYIYKDGALTLEIAGACEGVSTLTSTTEVYWRRTPCGGDVYMCGLFGLLRLAAEGELSRVTNTPTDTVSWMMGDTYYTKRLTDSELAEVCAPYAREGFLRGGLEVWRVGANGDELVFSLDPRYGVMICEIYFIIGDTLRFRADYFVTTGMTHREYGWFEYELQGGKLTAVSTYDNFPFYGETRPTAEQWLALENARLEELNEPTTASE